MSRHAHVQIVARRPSGAFDAWVDGAPAILHVAAPSAPLTDPASCFYGGQGLRPPFRPLPHHVAAVWARAEPARVLGHGVGPEGPWVALRKLDARPLGALRDTAVLDAACVEDVFRQLATELAALHAAGLLHRHLAAERVIVAEGEVRLAGLSEARLDGVGPPRAVGPGTVEDDLRALGAIARWMLGDHAPTALSAAVSGIVAALAGPIGDMPASANDVLAAMGAPYGPPAAVPPPHPALAAWHDAAWADRYVADGLVWELVREADARALDRWGLAALAGRLLGARLGSEGWLALGTLCAALADQTCGSEREAYRAQAEEARMRAGVRWHPAASALRSVLAHGPRVDALCALQRPHAAEALARREGRGGGLALAGWARRDAACIDEGLARAEPHDLDAHRVTAARALAAAPERAGTAARRIALPEAQLEAVRHRCARGDLEGALRLCADFPPPVDVQARLRVALAAGAGAEAAAAAHRLARAGAWDAVVAATLLVYGGEADPVRPLARRVLATLAPRVDRAGLEADARARLATDPADPLGWAGLLGARVGDGDVDGPVDALAAADAAPAAWSLLVLELFAAGRLEEARSVALTALRRWPGDVALSALEACVALFDGDTEVARRAAEHAVAQDPGSPWGWLARAAWATWTGDGAQARGAIRAAARRGGDGTLGAALAACLPGAAGPSV